MFCLENNQVRFALSERAEIVQFQNKITGHEYIAQPRGCWTLILRDEYGDLLLEGTFVDDEGIELDNPLIVAKSYKAADRLAVAVWNPSSGRQPLCIQAPRYRLIKVVTINGEAKPPPGILDPNQIAVLIYVTA